MGYDVKELMRTFNEYRAYKQSVIKDWRFIRSLYKGNFWEEFKKHTKSYTLTPDWNYVDYATQAYCNSIYSGAFIGTLTPTTVEGDEYVRKLNRFITYNWNKWNMKSKFLHVGENGELYNLGAVRVDWNETKGVIIKELSPDELYFDPSVSSYKDGQAIFIERAININKLKKDPRYAKKVEAYEKKASRLNDKTSLNRLAVGETRQTTDNKTVSLIECFIRNGEGTIDQIFILDEAEIIYEEETDLDVFPIAVFTPARPDGNPYGKSRFHKITNSLIVLNIMDSMEATQPYRLLNRVRLINTDGRINMRAFSEYGNTPGASFEVKGNPKDLITYVDVPTIPDMSVLKSRLENSIFQVTGVDPYYKGRMTNSIQTTGATQAFQARVTMLTDNSRITLLEEFCEDLTRLVLKYYTMYSASKAYNIPKYSDTGTNKVIGVDSLVFDDTPYDYMINASVLLPMNQANLFESAKALYEMQGQYQFKTPVITEEDLIKYSDFPQKDLILQRLERDKQGNTAQDLVADLTNFASIFSRMLSQGVPEDQAAEQAIQILIEEKNAMMQDHTLGQGFQ